MKIIISPAKKMISDPDSFEIHSLPAFLERTSQIYQTLKSKSYQELKEIWKCNDSIASLNYQRLQQMNLYQQLTPALMAYDGIQYSYMLPGAFEDGELEYLEQNLRILSAFYGILRPFDGVTPYRLEMQAKLSINGCQNLYHFWGSALADSLFRETSVIINLASQEYSQCISHYLKPDIRFITCVFGELQNGVVREKGTLCKMVRGEMVRYLAENKISEPEKMKLFCRLGYHYCSDLSDETHYIFLKEETNHAGNPK